MELKHHHLITILVELACVCLLFATIMGFFPVSGSSNTAGGDSLVVESESNTLGQTSIIITNKDGTTSTMNGTTAIFGSSNLEGETGKLDTYYYVNGSIVEMETDENGNVYYKFNTQDGSNPSFVVTKPEETPSNADMSSSPLGILTDVIGLLSCVLLLLYTLKFYNHNKANLVLCLVFALAFLAQAVALCGNLSSVFGGGAVGIFGLIIAATQAIPCILFVLLAVTALKDKLTPKIALISMIAILACTLLPILSGGFIAASDVLSILAALLSLVGTIAFTVAWFLCAFKVQTVAAEVAAPVTEVPAE